MIARTAVLATPIAAALLVALTACAAPAAPATSSSSSTTTSTAATSATSAATAAPTAAAGPIDACTLLPVATVAKIMGLAYVTGESTSHGADASECGYDTKGISLDHLTLQIQLTGGKGESDDDQQVIVVEGDKPIPLAGLGDSAYEAPEGSDVRIEKAFGALWGDTYATVGGPVKISEAQARQLLTAAHDAL